jgi:uncharacterized protein (UPF0303 family)
MALPDGLTRIAGQEQRLRFERSDEAAAWELGSLLRRSSYGVGRSLEREGPTLEGKLGLPLRDFASHGGGSPTSLTSGCWPSRR